MDDQRAEGFWWVRDDGRWQVVEVRGGWVHWAGAMSRVDECVEWGPYLGKEPEPQPTLSSIDPQHTKECGTASRGCSPSCTFERDQPSGGAAALARGFFDAFTDYEGEDTRALDGAGETIAMPSEDGGPSWTVTIVATPDLESAAAEHARDIKLLFGCDEMIPLDEEPKL